MLYELKLALTVSGVGCFSTCPGPNLSFHQMVDHLRAHPWDDFMHRFLLEQMAGHRTRKVEKLIDQALGQDPLMTALLYEVCLTHDRYAALLPRFKGQDPLAFCAQTPLIHLRSAALADQDLHARWNEIFHANIADHQPLPAPGETGLPCPLPPEVLLASRPEPAHVRDIQAGLVREGLPAPKPRVPLAETIARATEALERVGVLIGPMMQHRASLSRVARLRHWRFEVSTRSGNLDTVLTGIQTSYGRGFSEDAASAACHMEVCERVSSYASYGRKGMSGYDGPRPLVHGAVEELSARGLDLLDLAALRLEVPYLGQRLYWLEGHGPDGRGQRPVLVPAQLVTLFCNLDEPCLTSGLSSTGLGAGNTMEEAKISALCELLERDAGAVTPCEPSRVFEIETDDPELSAHLRDLRDCGIRPRFLDLTGDLGIPCYAAFVLGAHGDVNKGTGCGLSGRRALVSALTEVPYPFPGPATRPFEDQVPVRRLEDLPDYSTGSAKGDLLVLESTLLANGLRPAYVDLTRADLGIPVCRAMVPGLEIMTDLDHFCRVSPRLWTNYQALFGK
jgi:YcaO-like protein with predicted kinase domain